MRLQLTALAFMASTTHALAGPPPATRATLAAPVERHMTVIVNDAVWNCTDATCTGPDGNGRMGNYRSCRELAARVGLVASFTSHGEDFTAEELLRCNAHANAR